MKDKNGEKLKAGDWVLFAPENKNAGVRAAKISRIKNSIAFIFSNYYFQNDPTPWHRVGNDLEKISEEQAMIYILENS